MKKILAILTLLILVAAISLIRSFSAAVLPIGEPPKIELPANTSPETLSVTAISAGQMLTKAGLAYRGGSFDDERIMTMGGILIKHPEGNLLIDAGFASNIDEHFVTTPKMMQWTSEYKADKTVVEQLPQLGLEASELTAVILTHAHWDHVSGLADLPNTPVWVTEQELNFVNSESELTKLARIIGTENYQAFSFDDGPYLGFESSYDVFDDGAVVIVPAAGHTPGAIIVFTTLANNQRYAFIGDLAWQKEGIDIPAEKPWLPRTLVQEDKEAVRKLLVHIHHLQNEIPNLQVVPSHDEQAWNELPSVQSTAR